MKNIYFIIIIILVIIYILDSIRKNKISINTSFGWMVISIIMLVLAIFPKSIDWLAVQVGISYPPALLLTIVTVILLVQNFNSSKKIYFLQEKLNYLEQELTLLKKKGK